MKLVMTYFESDGYTYSCDITKPFEYQSLEAAYIDFMLIFEEYKKKFEVFHRGETKEWVSGEVSFAGFDIDLSTFRVRRDGGTTIGWDEPKIQTIEEWFEENKSPSNFTLGIHENPQA